MRFEKNLDRPSSQKSLNKTGSKPFSYRIGNSLFQSFTKKENIVYSKEHSTNHRSFIQKKNELGDKNATKISLHGENSNKEIVKLKNKPSHQFTSSQFCKSSSFKYRDIGSSFSTQMKYPHMSTFAKHEISISKVTDIIPVDKITELKNGLELQNRNINLIEGLSQKYEAIFLSQLSEILHLKSKIGKTINTENNETDLSLQTIRICNEMLLEKEINQNKREFMKLQEENHKMEIVLRKLNKQIQEIV